MAQLLLDTSTLDGAHSCGLDYGLDVNDPDRLQVWVEHGGVTIIRGSGKSALTLELTNDEARSAFRALLAADRSMSPQLRLARAS